MVKDGTIEQTEGLSIGSATDVYSLKVYLYNPLTLLELNHFCLSW